MAKNNKNKNKKICYGLILIGLFLLSISTFKVLEERINDSTYGNISNISGNISNISGNINVSGNISMYDNGNFSHPNMYIDINDIRSIKDKVRANQQWRSIYDNLMKDANNSLNIPIQSVTFGGKNPPSKDNHDYYTDYPIISDGISDPNADRSDYTAAKKLGKTVRDLGLAYEFTEDVRYADKAIQLINAWTVNPSTKMNPKFTDGQSHIELTISMSNMFYGADLIWNYPDWNISDKNAFKSWAAQMINSSKTWSYKNNLENWKLVFISSASVITEDVNSRQYAFDRWKSIIADQMNSDGSMKEELKRTNSLSYSVFAINAMIQTAEIALHYDVDLYNYKLSDGRGLEKALDFYVPYVANPSTWPKKQINPYNGDGVALYELAYSFKQKSSYKDVINIWGRPMYDSRIMGPVTLTHANSEII